MRQQIQNRQQRLSRAAERAQRAARLRAQQMSDQLVKVRKPRGATEQAERWNVLLSELEDGLVQGRGKLPPERYRPAIEQYFNLINQTEEQGQDNQQ